MPIPDPRSFFGKKCVIRLKNGTSVVKTVQRIDGSGVVVDEKGDVATYLFKDIELLSLAK